MKRLTRRISNTNRADCAYCTEEFTLGGNCKNNCKLRLSQIAKLAAYEDAHEIYIKHTGDMVYYIGQGEVWDCIFGFLDFCEDGRITFSIIDTEGESITCELPKWGKTVFQSEPEAHKALSECGKDR